MRVMSKARRRRLPVRFDRPRLDALLADWRKGCGRRVTRRRLLLGASRRDLADLAGATEATITRIENGKINASDRLRLAIAGVLHCEVADLWPYPSTNDMTQEVA